MRILSQESLRPIVVLLQKSPYDDPLRINADSDCGDEFAHIFHAHRPCPKLYGGDRSEFKQSQSRCKDAVAALAENLTNCPRSEFQMEPLYQRAGIEEELQRLPASAFLNDQVAERPRNMLQTLLYLFGGWCWFVSSFGGFGLAMRQVLVVVSFIERFDDEGDAFFVVDRHALDRMEDAILVNGFNMNSHDFSLDDLS